MSLTSTRHILLLGVDLLILVVGVGHLPGILERSRVPFEAATANDTVRVTRILNMPAAGGLREGDAILRFAGVPVSHHDALEDLGDLLSVGERLTVDAVCDGRPETLTVRVETPATAGRPLVRTIFNGRIVQEQYAEG